MKVFPFPFLSLLNKITEGQLDALTCAKSLKLQGVILEDFDIDIWWDGNRKIPHWTIATRTIPPGDLLPRQLPYRQLPPRTIIPLK